jgi:hypothetical protein
MVLALALWGGTARAEEPHPTLPADAPLLEPEVIPPPPLEPPSPETHPWLALAEVTAVNLTVFTWNLTIGNKEWGRVSLESWKENLRTGFVWDEDGFSTNQFMHPYHGGLYYASARDNGMSFPVSAGYTLVGSLQWELFAETEHPSINDLVNTTMGGVAMGEALYRMSSMVLDPEKRGGKRFLRELGGAALSPMRGINRLLRGDTFRHEPKPQDWWPQDFAVWTNVGYLKLGDGESLAWGEDQFFAQFALRYGDMFRGDFRRPFDAFDARIQLTTREDSLISHARLQGMLAKQSLWTTETEELRLGLLQQLTYVDTIAYEMGGQALNAGLLHEHRFADKTSKVRTALLLDGSVLSGISSEHNGEGRQYDYGPGLGVQLQASYMRGAWEVVSLELGAQRVLVLDGSGGWHQVHTGQLLVDVPMFEHVGLGTELNFFQRQSRFDAYPPVTKDVYQLRVFVSVH